MKARTTEFLSFAFLAFLCAAAVLGALLIFCGCRAPDRWSLEATHGVGTLEAGGLREVGDRDFDSNALTLGISGPLLTASKPEKPEPVSLSQPADSTLYDGVRGIHAAVLTMSSTTSADLKAVRDEVKGLREDLQARPTTIEHGGGEAAPVKEGATQAVTLSVILGAALAAAKYLPLGWAKWKASREA